ncbi:hypothetical protein I5Q34_00810 [Streptomyces sp. AV19]|uniref:hypothetical protein n=1 Tax=Streptomyces sp. AV19 TaxID=2793068 RepID=UPI0018FE88DA|nr:hypothetical protein [Streptomyces sp. AV19]MBH1932846.1 hypothetical protein [Streptomyces sp. AV19]MDG4531524.1 hypothetical protein [Streptomyces sp. AV19]
MTDRAVTRRRRASVRTLLVIFGGVTVLLLGGLWVGRGVDRASAVSDAPKTEKAQKERADRSAAVEVGGTGELPGVRDCGYGEPLREPKIITLTCATGATVASDIEWDEYSTDRAEGYGVVQVSSGANGSARTSFPARLTLSAPRTVDGMTAFTSLEVAYTGLTPAGKTTETYSIA